jgi:hypothetical protein
MVFRRGQKPAHLFIRRGLIGSLPINSFAEGCVSLRNCGSWVWPFLCSSYDVIASLLGRLVITLWGVVISTSSRCIYAFELHHLCLRDASSTPSRCIYGFELYHLWFAIFLISAYVILQLADLWHHHLLRVQSGNDTAANIVLFIPHVVSLFYFVLCFIAHNARTDEKCEL